MEGDAGAPLEEEEITILEDGLDEIRPYMAKEGLISSRRTYKKHGCRDIKRQM